MAIDSYTTVASFVDCAREAVKLRKNSSEMKLFPANLPLEMVAIEILGLLLRSSRGTRYILVITGRFFKLVQMVPLKTTKGPEIAEGFVNNWMFVFGSRKKFPAEKGTQFNLRSFESICNILGIQNLLSINYNPQTNVLKKGSIAPYLQH